MSALFDTASYELPRQESGRWGNKNSARRVADMSRPEWMDWPRTSLHARAIRWIETYCIPSKGHRHGQPLTLADFQKEWLEEVLAPGVSAAGLTLPRGQGKTTFVGGVGTWALEDPLVGEEFGGRPQIPVVATAVKQAVRGVYGAALDFVRNHPELRNRTLNYTAAGDMRLVVPFNLYGEMFPVADDVDTLQGLDPMLSLVDEFGFISIDAWDSLLLAGGKRPRALTLGLGTRRPDDVPNALDHLVEMVSKHGAIEGFHLTDYSADTYGNPGDPEQWRKANPAIAAGFLSESALEAAYKLSPLASFKCFRLNLKTGAHDGWLGIEGPTHWDATARIVELDETEPSYVGVDKSAYGDCSAVALLQRYGATEWQCRVWIFHPVNGSIDHAAVRDKVRELHETYNLVAVGYDDRYFVEGAADLEAEGIPMEKVPQTRSRLVPAYSNLHRDIVTRTLWHDDDPVLRSHVLSAVPVVEPSGGFMLAKNKSRAKIDGAVALGIARSLTDIEPDNGPDWSAFRIN